MPNSTSNRDYDRQKLMIYDKRKLKRCDIFLIVEFKPLRSRGGFSIGITRDLSPDGFSLESQTIECQRGDILEFRLKHPDAEWAVDISGEVIWRNHSWYKYVIGIKFLEVTEEQNTKILKLMSAVKDEANKPDLNRKDSESIQGTEKEKHPETLPVAGAIDHQLPDTRVINANHVSLREAEHCELTGTERTFIAGDVVGISIAEGTEEIKPASDRDDSDKSFEAALIKDKASNPESAEEPVDDKTADRTTHSDIIEEADAEHEKIYAAHLNTISQRDTTQAPSLNINPAENNRKKKLWLYVPLAMVVIIILAVALPVMIEKFNHDSIDSIRALTESTDNNDVEKDKDVPSELMSNQALNDPSGPSSVQQTGTKDPIPEEQNKTANIQQASSAGKNSTGIIPPKSIVIAEVKSKKAEETAPPSEIQKPIKNTPQINNATVLKSEPSSPKPLRDNVEKNSKIDLIAKIDETFKELRAVQSEKPSEPEAVIETEKTPEDKPFIKSEEQPLTSQVVKLKETPAVLAITESEIIPEAKPLVKAKEQPVPPQVVKIKETPAAAAIAGGEMIAGIEQEKAREAKKVDIKKTEQSVKRPKMPSVALLVKRDNSRTNINNSPAATGVTTSDLLKNWKHIGSTKSGVPLFIAPDNITYPYEHVVNLLVKASVNKKDFIDLLAINCSQIKLRILEERNGNNPAFSYYSNEWKDIVPDSMVLYNSACPEKR